MFFEQRVEIKDHRRVLHKSRGVVLEVRKPDGMVLVETTDGRKCYIEPSALKVA